MDKDCVPLPVSRPICDEYVINIGSVIEKLIAMKPLAGVGKA